MLHPGIPAFHFEDHMPVPGPAKIFRNAVETVQRHELSRHSDVAQPDLVLSGALPREHVPPAEQLDLEFPVGNAGIPDLVHQHGDCLVSIAAVQFPGLPRSVRQHVMAHPAQKRAGMPESQGNAGSEHGPDAGFPVAEIEFARLKKDVHSKYSP